MVFCKLTESHPRMNHYLSLGLSLLIGLILITSTFILEHYIIYRDETLTKIWNNLLIPTFEYIPAFNFYLAPTTTAGLTLILYTTIKLLYQGIKQSRRTGINQ